MDRRVSETLKPGLFPGDDIYVNYPLNAKHKDDLNQLKVEIKNQTRIKSYVYAFKAETAFNQNDYPCARELCYSALKLDTSNLEAYRILSLISSKIFDVDTTICEIREYLSFARKIYSKEFQKEKNDVYCSAFLRPYVATLEFLADFCMDNDRVDLATLTLEDYLRIYPIDPLFKRSALLSCYIKILGMQLRNKDPHIKRTQEQLKKFLLSRNPLTDELFFNVNKKINGELFEGDELVIARWTPLFLSYINKENWRKLATKELKKTDWLLEDIMHCLIDEDAQEGKEKCTCIRCQMDSYAKFIFIDWPDFLVRLRRSQSNHTRIRFNCLVRQKTQQVDEKRSEEYKKNSLQEGSSALEEGRKALAEGKYSIANSSFSKARDCLYRASLPSGRWIDPKHFPVLSNRATAALRSKNYNILRLDTRFTLSMKPDHVKSYQKLPDIADAFGATHLKPLLQEIADSAAAGGKTEDEWRFLAAKAIALISLPGIHAGATTMAHEKFDITGHSLDDDVYGPFSIPKHIHPLPSWLEESDLDLTGI